MAFYVQIVQNLRNGFIDRRAYFFYRRLYHHRAFKICSTPKLFDQQVGKIKTFMAWNGFPTRVKNSVINRLFKKHTQTPQNSNNVTLENI